MDKITHKENFDKTLKLIPGTYEVLRCKLHVTRFANIDMDTNMLFLEAYTDIEKITLNRDVNVNKNLGQLPD